MKTRSLSPHALVFALLGLLLCLVVYQLWQSPEANAPAAKPTPATMGEAPAAEPKRVKFVSTTPRPKIAPIDTRPMASVTATDLQPERIEALAALRKDIPGVQVEFDPLSGAPARVQAPAAS